METGEPGKRIGLAVMTPTQHEILKAFRHRNRDEYVPWTAEELARRTGKHKTGIIKHLQEMSRMGLVSLQTITQGGYGSAGPMLAEVTPKGREMAG